MSTIEQIRQQNIARNQHFLKNLGISGSDSDSSAYRSSRSKSINKNRKKLSNESDNSESNDQPRRKSLRCANMTLRENLYSVSFT